MKQFVTFTLLVLFLVGCGEYRYTNRFRKIVKGDYIMNDTIYVKDYILCNGLRDFKENIWAKDQSGKPMPINEDSVLIVFQHSINKLKGNIHFLPNGQNHCDSSFHKNVYAKPKRIDPSRIIEIAQSSNKNLVLVPFIYIDNAYEHQATPFSGGGFLRNIQKMSALKILIYIVQNDEIIYLRSALHLMSSNHESMDEEADRQTQENWDILVRGVMRDYFKRAK